MSLSRAQQEVVSRVISHSAMDHLIDPKSARESAVSSQTGRTLEHDGRRGWGTVQAKGVGWAPSVVGTWTGRDQFEVYATWSEIAAHMLEVGRADRTLADDWRAYSRRNREHQTGTYSHPGKWRGIPWSVPVNAEGMTDDEVRTWWTAVHMPEYRELRQVGARLVERGFPLLVDHEPMDLLELLAAGS